MAREEAISILLGYISICCWLGAQFPQIIVNWRRKSVDGLALPFLANWLLGDTTNLIGCLFTDQLPFQTYLATYFVFVDICLVAQFVYYDASNPAQPLAILTPSSAHHSRTSLVSHSPQARAFPRTHMSRSRSRSYSMDPHLRAAVANIALATSELDARHQDSLASEVDFHSSQGRRRTRGPQRASSLEGLPESIAFDPRERDWGGRRPPSLEREGRQEAVDAESDSAPSAVTDSLRSESEGRGRGRGKHVSWTRESTSRDRDARRLSLDPLTMDIEPPNTAPQTVRGRPLTRAIVYESPTAPEPSLPLDDRPPRSRRTSAASVVSAAASRRSASIVFLGVFALLGLSSHMEYRSSGGSEGDVLTRLPSNLPPRANDAPLSSYFSHTTPLPSDPIVHPNGIQPHTSADGDTQRFIGRISAWSCTTLYLTSRLPQIWKNFARKSVEGLSMYLFIFAFLGNFFYVLSILSNPKMDLPPPHSRQFIRDSVPYLLGSGGTLMFDVTIVLQSLVYAPGRRGLRVRRRRRSLLQASGEEERGLLEANQANEDAP